MAGKRRLDKNRVTLRKGESYRSDGRYSFRWCTRDGKRHYIYAKTLDELRRKEMELTVDQFDGIRTDKQHTTVNDVFELWCELKRGLKDNTFQNYKYMYNNFVRNSFGKLRVSNVKKSDVKKFYNTLADEKILQISTIDTVHNILHQVFALAVDDNYIRQNPTDEMLKELKKSHGFQVTKRKALTVPEQELFIQFLKTNAKYKHWYPVFATMLGTGMRVGEITGLRWCDLDFKENLIHVNHTLVYYNKGDNNGCSFAINSTKTPASFRTIPMLASVKEAFLMEKAYQEEVGLSCSAKVDGYTNFIFINRFGNTQHQGTLNKAIRRIIRDCNDAVLLKATDDNPVLLPPFSCHSLRHTFTTRLCEEGVNVKVIQDVLGHADFNTTMDIYTDVTNDLKQKEFSALDVKMVQ
ncbi:MAG: site-specific integrase [Clostridia bacterium]|nr:site-specific integrase [Clostridia bacterium]